MMKSYAVNEITLVIENESGQSSGSRFWFNYKSLHRKDGPAIEWNNGSREWYYNGHYKRQES